MNSRHIFRVVVAAAVLWYPATFLDAQSTSLGVVDSGTTSVIDLAVADQVTLEYSGDVNTNQFSTSSGVAKQSVASNSSARLFQSKKPQNSTASRAYNQPLFFGTPPALPLSSSVPTSKYSSVHSFTATEPAGRNDSRHRAQASQVKLKIGDAGTTGSIQSAQQGPLEKLEDPFSGLLKNNFEGFNNNLHAEQP